MAPISRLPMNENGNRTDEQNLPSPVPFNEFSQDENDRGASNPLVPYSSFFSEYSVTAEFNLFAQQNLPGVYCIPSSADPNEWFGVLFLRQGMYQGAILRFSLKLPSDFPDTETPPSVVFEIAVFHPDIDAESGELNVKRGFPTWRCGIHHVYQILVYMQRCFFTIECVDPVLNAEAARLYKEDIERYCERAVDSIRRSREVVYDPPQITDANALKFTPWDQTVHEPIRTHILKSVRTTSATPGGSATIANTSSYSPASNRTASGCAGLSFFNDKTFCVMAKENTWTAPLPALETLDFGEVVGWDQRRLNKPAKSSSKSKLTV